jgi:dUTP pyrophosphatase
MVEPMILKIFIEDEELKLAYIEHIEKHNQKILGSKFPDSGFDLLTPDKIILDSSLLKLDFKIKCSAEINGLPVSYYIYPRSSLATKTNLRFANSVGIIDSGYRGNISGVFDVIIFHVNPYREYNIEKYSRLVQICAPDLRPIVVQLVELEKDLSEETERKYGGFGSTG